MAPGWQTVQVTLPDYDHRVEATIIVPSPDAELGMISDIDDTVIRTGAYWLPRSLWTTATTFISDRGVFQDTVALLQQLHARTNAVFHVSFCQAGKIDDIDLDATEAIRRKDVDLFTGESLGPVFAAGGSDQSSPNPANWSALTSWKPPLATMPELTTPK